MAQDTLTYVMSEIFQVIPRELLELAFKPTQYNTTIEQRIITEIIEGPILLDTNLIGGKRREIIINPNWKIELPPASGWDEVGAWAQGSFYKIPPEAREGRNIASVIGLTQTMGGHTPGTSLNANGRMTAGNTAQGLISAMLNTRTFADTPETPLVTLEGTNIIRFYPVNLITTRAVTVMLEYDSAFLNMNTSAIVAMMELCVVATMRYIATRLRVSVDETEVVAGMEIGVIKDYVNEYKEKGEGYKAALIKLKGAMHYDPKSFNRMIYYGL